MPTLSCIERLQRGGLSAFIASSPGILLSVLGWIGFLVGFGWLNERSLIIAASTASVPTDYTNTIRGIKAEYYLLAVSPPIYFILVSFYLLTGLWTVGMISQVAATLVMLAAGGITYYVGILVATVFENRASLTDVPLTEPEIYLLVMFGGSVLACVGMVFSMTVVPVIGAFQHIQISVHSNNDESYARFDSNRHQKTRLMPSMFTLPANILTAMGWITFTVGFGWLNQQIFLQQATNAYNSYTGRWSMSVFYILATSTPIYCFMYSMYMLTGHWTVGMISQFGAVVVTMAAGGMTYFTGIIVTQTAELLSRNRFVQLQDGDIFLIVAFAGAVVVSVGMALSNALVPAMSSIYLNRPLLETNTRDHDLPLQNQVPAGRYEVSMPTAEGHTMAVGGDPYMKS